MKVALEDLERAEAETERARIVKMLRHPDVVTIHFLLKASSTHDTEDGLRQSMREIADYIEKASRHDTH